MTDGVNRQSLCLSQLLASTGQDLPTMEYLRALQENQAANEHATLLSQSNQGMCTSSTHVLSLPVLFRLERG
jgi:hypothetical protein